MSTGYPTSLDNWAVLLLDNTDSVMAAHVNDLRDSVEVLQIKLGVDNSAVVTTIDYFLRHASGNYRTHTHTGASDDGAVVPINNLSDVDINSLTDNQFLRYNSSSGKWENETFTLAINSLSDVNTSGVAQYSGLVYNGSSWEDGFPNAYYAA